MKVMGQHQGKNFAIYNGDCVEVAKGLPDNSIHYSIFSPPFASCTHIQIAKGTWGTARPMKNFIRILVFL